MPTQPMASSKRGDVPEGSCLRAGDGHGLPYLSRLPLLRVSRSGSWDRQRRLSGYDAFGLAGGHLAAVGNGPRSEKQARHSHHGSLTSYPPHHLTTGMLPYLAWVSWAFLRPAMDCPTRATLPRPSYRPNPSPPPRRASLVRPAWSRGRPRHPPKATDSEVWLSTHCTVSPGHGCRHPAPRGFHRPDHSHTAAAIVPATHNPRHDQTVSATLPPRSLVWENSPDFGKGF